MKTTLLTITLAVLTSLSAWADINIAETNQQPSSLLVRNSIVPMLRFVASGTYADISAFVIRADGPLNHVVIGKVTVEAAYLSAPQSIISTTPVIFNGIDSTLRIPVRMKFGALGKWYFTTVNLEMASDLRLSEGESLKFSLVAVESDQVVSGSFPISGETHTINNRLSIGRISVNSAGQSQNPSIGAANQVVGSFDVNVGSAEPMISTSTTFHIETPGQYPVLVKNVVLVNSQNTVVAGPVDVASVGETIHLGKITFTDAITFPKSAGTYYLKANIGSSMKADSLLRIYTNPSDWSVRGATYGYQTSARPIGEAVFGQTMTLKGPALRISLNPDPNPETVVSGLSEVRTVQVVLDATESSEDVRMSSLGLNLSVSNLAPTDLANCFLSDGATRLNTGFNLINPTQVGNQFFLFDSTIIVAKGTTKTLDLRLNLRSQELTAPKGSFTWSLLGTSMTNPIGIVSGNIALLTFGTEGKTTTVVPRAGAELNSLVVTQRVGFPDDWRTATLAFQGQSGLTYIVEESTDLVNWHTVLADQSSWQPNENGLFTVTAYLLPGEDYKFFRALGHP